MVTNAHSYTHAQTVPSWLNEKKEDVSINKSIWWSVGICVIVFVAIGVLGALALDFSGGGDLLSTIDDPSITQVYPKVAHRGHLPSLVVP